jgi:hypothetical protein
MRHAKPVILEEIEIKIIALYVKIIIFLNLIKLKQQIAF